MSRFRVVALCLCYIVLVPSRPIHAEPAPKGQPKRTDRYGDPLPEGAIARLGTLRFRSGTGMFSVAYSPDGRLLATAGYGRTVDVWQTATGKEVFRFLLRPADSPDRVDVEFSPDGRTLAVAGGSGENTIRMWDMATGKECPGLNIPNGGNASKIAFSPDGNTLGAICGVRKGRKDYNRICLWHVKAGKEVAGFESPQGHCLCLAFAPDGKSLAVGQDGEVCMWDTATGRKLRTLRRYKGNFAAVAFSADGTIASATQDETLVRLWDAATGREKHVLRGHKEMVGTLIFSRDGKRLISSGCSDYNTFRAWDVATGELLHTHRDGVGGIDGRCIALSPDGKTMAVAKGGLVLIRLDVATGEHVANIPGHIHSVRILTFIPDGRVVTSDGGTDVRLWDAATGKEIACMRKKEGLASRFALSPDGQIVAAGLWDGTIRLWELETGKERRKLRSDIGPCLHLALAPDGKTLAAGHSVSTKWYVCTILLWDTVSGKTVHQLQPPGNAIGPLALSPDGKRLASLGAELCLWDTVNGKELGPFQAIGARSSAHNTVCFSPDGWLLAAPCYPKGFAVWNVETRGLVGHFDGNGESSESVAFSPDGRLLACGKDDGTVELWDTLAWTLAGKRQGPNGRVYALAFSADGRLLGSGHEDTTALIWDVPSLWTPKEAATNLTKDQLEALWEQLGSAKAAEALRAVAALSQAPADTLPFLSKSVHPARAGDAEKVAGLIADLDADAFAVREKAVKGLQARGPAVIPALRQAMRADPSPEARRRMVAVLEAVGSKKPHELVTAEEKRAVRAVALLEQIGTSQARQLLDKLAGGDPEARLSREARSALTRLKSSAAP